MSTPKYKVGDFVTMPRMVYLEIIIVIPGDLPVYALRSIKNQKKLSWHTEFELDKMQLEKATPDFAKWEKIRIGDSVLVREESGSHNHRVLARSGKAVLLSMHPSSRKEAVSNANLERQLNELVEEMEEHAQDNPTLKMSAKLLKTTIAPPKDELNEEFERLLHTSKAYDMAGSWYTTRELALMNWELLTE